MQLMKWAQFSERKIDALCRVMSIIAISILLAMMLLTVLDVVLRAFFNRPIIGTVELIEIAMICVGYLGLAWCAMKGMHIKVDLVVSFMPKKAQAVIDSFCYFLCLGTCLFIARQTYLEGIAIRDMKAITPNLQVPLFPFYWVISFGYVVLTMAILILFTKSLKEALKK